jgi:hypothetical protein
MKEKDISNIKLINECLKKNKEFNTYVQVEYDQLINDENLIEICVECISNLFSNDGLDENDEPNKYGLELYHLIEYLNNMRYTLQDRNKNERK